MPSNKRSLAFLLSIPAGILLIVSGTQGPIGIYEIVLQQMPLLIKNEPLLSIINTAALILRIISLVGGFTVLAGGFLIYRNHVAIGKLAIGLGAGVGIPWLLLLLLTLITTAEVSAILAQHSIVGWTGMILAFIARTIPK